MLQQPGRDLVVRSPLVVRSGPSEDAPFVGNIFARTPVRVGYVRPDGWFTVIRPADGSVVGYARLGAPSDTSGDSWSLPGFGAVWLTLVLVLMLGVWALRVVARARRPSAPFWRLDAGKVIRPAGPADVENWPLDKFSVLQEHPNEICCVQAKCWRKTPVPTKAVDQLIGRLGVWRGRYRPLSGQLRGVLVVWNTLDEAARRDARGNIEVHEGHQLQERIPGHLWDQAVRARTHAERRASNTALGEWYENVVAAQYASQGYAVYARRDLEFDDRGVDLVCVR